MTHAWDSSTFTQEFGHEFEADRERWLRKRFLWYSGVLFGMNVLGLVSTLIQFQLDPPHRTLHTVALVSVIITLGVYAWAFTRARSTRMSREALLNIAMWLIIISGAITLLTGPISLSLADFSRPGLGVTLQGTVPERERGALVGTHGIAALLLTHVIACLFLPWKPLESLRPMVPLLVLNAVITIALTRGGWLGALTIIVLSPLIAAPGMLICWWRHSRYRDRFASRAMRGRYAEMKRELIDARRIHESVFPDPVLAGPLTLDYRYEPARQIGGDYLFARVTPGSDPARHAVLNLVIIDVTGHGIPAALTVNRLHGELERIFAERPGARPGDVLALLNSYIHLTLASHSVYVTAICVRVDSAADTLEYASGGHPPAFLRAVDGTVEQLDSTSLVLGASPADAFEADPRTLRFGPGDTLIAYTDGATEARDTNGRYFGIAGLQRLIALGHPDTDGGWPLAVHRAVAAHRAGPTADDLLIVQVVRPIAEAPATRRGVAGAAHHA